MWAEDEPRVEAYPIPYKSSFVHPIFGLELLEVHVPVLDRIIVAGEAKEPSRAVFARMGPVMHKLLDLAEIGVQDDCTV
jgi:hypothetical protein